jgi:hypothetical protein
VLLAVVPALPAELDFVALPVPVSLLVCLEIVISTRLFFARFSSVSFGATGSKWEYPSIDSLLWGSPLSDKKFNTVTARSEDNCQAKLLLVAVSLLTVAVCPLIVI